MTEKMKNNKIIDCVTFFDNNFMFEIRYNILVNYVDYFVICESKYDHKGKKKEISFSNFVLIFFAGIPIMTAFSETSLVTTAFAPIFAFFATITH